MLENKNDVLNFDDWTNDALGCIESRTIFREILSSGLTNIVRIFQNQVHHFLIGTIKELVGREMMVY